MTNAREALEERAWQQAERLYAQALIPIASRQEVVNAILLAAAPLFESRPIENEEEPTPATSTLIERLRKLADLGEDDEREWVQEIRAVVAEAADALTSPPVPSQHDEIERLREELSASQQTNREWLAANGPGGWIDDLRRKLTSPPALSGWQPIESAPKDGTPILGGGGTEIPCVMRCFGMSWSTIPAGYSVHPTHWMPLPSGPGQHAKDALPPSSDNEDHPFLGPLTHVAEVGLSVDGISATDSGGDALPPAPPPSGWPPREREVFMDGFASGLLSTSRTHPHGQWGPEVAYAAYTSDRVLPPAPPVEDAIATIGALLDQMHMHARDVEDVLLHADIEVARKALQSIGATTRLALGQDSPAKAPAVHVGQPCKACGGTGLVIETDPIVADPDTCDDLCLLPAPVETPIPLSARVRARLMEMDCRHSAHEAGAVVCRRCTDAAIDAEAATPDPIAAAVDAQLDPLKRELVEAGRKLANAIGWRCDACHTLILDTAIDLGAVVCGCGLGKGRWGVEVSSDPPSQGKEGR